MIWQSYLRHTWCQWCRRWRVDWRLWCMAVSDTLSGPEDQTLCCWWLAQTRNICHLKGKYGSIITKPNPHSFMQRPTHPSFGWVKLDVDPYKYRWTGGGWGRKWRSTGLKNHTYCQLCLETRCLWLVSGHKTLGSQLACMYELTSDYHITSLSQQLYDDIPGKLSGYATPMLFHSAAEARCSCGSLKGRTSSPQGLVPTAHVYMRIPVSLSWIHPSSLQVETK